MIPTVLNQSIVLKKWKVNAKHLLLIWVVPVMIARQKFIHHPPRVVDSHQSGKQCGTYRTIKAIGGILHLRLIVKIIVRRHECLRLHGEEACTGA